MKAFRFLFCALILGFAAGCSGDKIESDPANGELGLCLGGMRTSLTFANKASVPERIRVQYTQKTASGATLKVISEDECQETITLFYRHDKYLYLDYTKLFAHAPTLFDLEITNCQTDIQLLNWQDIEPDITIQGKYCEIASYNQNL